MPLSDEWTPDKWEMHKFRIPKKKLRANKRGNSAACNKLPGYAGNVLLSQTPLNWKQSTDMTITTQAFGF